MAAPILTTMSPIYGQIKGVTSVTLTGAGFSVLGLQVFFGTQLATNVVPAGDNSLTCDTPVVDSQTSVLVKVVTNDGESNVLEFFFLNLLSAPSYAFSNPFFDPLADYTVMGNWKFVKPIDGETTGGGGGSATAWDENGNSPVAPAIFGTLNAQPISFRANNIEYMQFDVATQRLDVVVDNFQVNTATLVGINSDQVSIQAVSGIAIGTTSVPEVVIGNDTLPTNIVSIQAPHVFLDFIQAGSKPDVLFYDSATKEVFFAPAPGGGSGWLLTGNTGAGHVLGLTDTNDFQIIAASGAPKITFNGGTGDVSIFANPGGDFLAQGVGATLHSLITGTTVSASLGDVTILASSGQITLNANGGGGNISSTSQGTTTIASLGTLAVSSSVSGSLIANNDLTVEATTGTLGLNSGVDTLMQSGTGITQIRTGSPVDPGVVPAKSLKVVSEGVVAGGGYQGVTWTAFGGNLQLDAQAGNASVASSTGTMSVSGQTQTTVQCNAGNLDLQAPAGEVNVSALAGAINLVGLANSATSQILHYNSGTGRVTFASGAPITQVVVQTFSTPGAATYTPTAGMKYCEVQVLGAGGSGGGASTTDFAATGGGAGGYCVGLFDAATIGVSQAISVGAGGAAVTNANGNAGGNTTFGALMTANGGGGGFKNLNNQGGPGGTATGGYYQATGNDGCSSFLSGTAGVYAKGGGGASFFGGQKGGYIQLDNANNPGDNATASGAGGQGSISITIDQLSGAGGDGLVIVTEYI